MNDRSAGAAPLTPPAYARGDEIDHPIWRLGGLADALRRAAHERPDGLVTCIDHAGHETSFNYRALYDDARRIAATWQAQGLAPGARVVLRLADPGAFVRALWACFLGGYVAIPTHAHGALPADAAAARGLATSLRALDPAALLVCAEEQARAVALKDAHGWSHLVVLTDALGSAAAQAVFRPVAADPERVAVIFPTSGSTGAPKPVMQTERALLGMSAGSAQMNAFGPDDVFLNWMPLEHVGAVVFLGVLPVCTMADQVHVDYRLWRDGMLDWLDAVSRFRASVGWVPNHVFHIVSKLLEDAPARAWDLSALRFLVNAGESVSPLFVRRFAQSLQRFGLREDAIRPAFGMSETCSGITWAPGFHVTQGRYVDLGAPIPGAEMRIVDPDGRLLPEGHVGHLHLRGPSVTQGYFGAPRDEKFLSEHWFDSGDAGFMEHGRLYLTDREGDAIVLDGVAVHGHEIEAAIESLPGVRGGCTAVCSVVRDEAPVLAAFYCLAATQPPPAEVHAQVESVLTRLAPGVRTVAIALSPQEVPRTAIGKIQRKVLRRRLDTSNAGASGHGVRGS